MTISAERLGELRDWCRPIGPHEERTQRQPAQCWENLTAACEELLALRQKVEKLAPYVQHKSDCGISDDGEYTWACTCGLSAIRRLLEG